MILTKQLTKTDWKDPIDTEDLSKRIYFVQLGNSEFVRLVKL